jgi:hypothetical protein
VTCGLTRKSEKDRTVPSQAIWPLLEFDVLGRPRPRSRSTLASFLGMRKAGNHPPGSDVPLAAGQRVRRVVYLAEQLLADLDRLTRRLSGSGGLGHVDSSNIWHLGIGIRDATGKIPRQHNRTSAASAASRILQDPAVGFQWRWLPPFDVTPVRSQFGGDEQLLTRTPLQRPPSNSRWRPSKPPALTRRRTHTRSAVRPDLLAESHWS